MGEFESLNFSIGVPPSDIALFHALYRTSIKGRKDIISVIFGNEGIKKIDASYTSRVAEIFTVILKSLGISIDFVDEDDDVCVLDDDHLTQHELNGKTYFCTEYQFFLIQRIEDIRNEILEDNPILTESTLQQMIEAELKTRAYINGPLTEEIGDELEKRVEEEIAEIVKKLQKIKEEENAKITEQNTSQEEVATTEDKTLVKS